MSGEPTDNDPPVAAPVGDDGGAGESGAGDSTIPVEVEPPDPPPIAAVVSPTAELEAKVATLEKEKKDNFDKYLRAVADLENARKRQRRELEDAKIETRGKVLKEMLPVVD